MKDRTPERGEVRASGPDEPDSREDDQPPVAGEPERERLIEAVHVREHFLEGILGTLEPFATVDRDWRVTFVNRAATEFIGRPSSELVGRDVRELRRFGATERSAALLERAMTERVAVEVDIVDPTRQRQYLAAVQPIDGDGLAIYLRDVTEQVRVHEALLESEERFRTLADQSPFLIWVTGPGGDIEFVNRPYREFFGLTEDDVRRQGWQPLVHPSDAEAYVEEFMTAVRERWAFAAEARVRDARGEWRWVDSHAVPRLSASGEFLGMVGSSPDVTGRHCMEEALRGSEEMLRTVLDNSRDGINMLDLRTGRYVFMNDAQVALTGFTAEEINGLSAQEAYERVHPDDRRVSVEHQRRVATGEDIDEPVEYRWKVKSGEYRWFSDRRKSVRDAEGRPIALVGTSRDITRRKSAEAVRERQHLVLSGIATILQAALTASGEEQLGDTCLRVVEQLTESAFGFVGRMDEDGVLRDVALSDSGPHAVAVWGRRGDRRSLRASQTCGLLERVVATGEPLLTNSPADQPEAVALPPGHPPLTALLCVPLGNGDHVSGVVAVANREGGYSDDQLAVLLGVAPVIREAFDRRRAEEDLRTNELHAAAQRERNRLARDLHDSVTQALFAATMKSEALTLNAGLPTQAEDTVEEVRRLTRGALAQMRTLLLELRGDPLEKVPLRQLLRHLVEATESRTSTEVRLTIRGQSPPPELHTPVYRIVQEALNNIVRHAGAAGAWVLLDLHDTVVRLEVGDDGVGFDPDRVDAGHLGLRSMRERAVEAGGTLQLHTAQGEGTRVLAEWRVGPPDES